MIFRQSSYRYYDHRIKELIAKSKNANLFPELDIPRSTAMQWIQNGPPEVVTLPKLELTNEQVLLENIELKNKVDSMKAENELVITTFRLFGLQIQYKRLPSAKDKESLLAAITKAQNFLSLKDCLKALDLTLARYYAWTKKKVNCLLEFYD